MILNTSGDGSRVSPSFQNECESVNCYVTLCYNTRKNDYPEYLSTKLNRNSEAFKMGKRVSRTLLVMTKLVQLLKT